ncbi:MAG: sugar ABC transporter permease [Granulosicoccus sp.]|nr:sugar ABC transporter permease [Granulosicoccus sp.]
MARNASDKKWAAILMGPGVLLTILFIVVPFALAFYLSFTNQRLVPNLNIPTSFIGFRNYERLLTRDEFWTSLGNTAFFVTVIVPLQGGIALAVAMLVNSKLPGRNLFRGIYFIPTVITMVVVSVIWSVLYSTNGFFNQFIQAISFGWLDPVDWLRNSSTAMPAIILLSTWQGFPFQMVIYLAGLQAINPELYEAAKVEGSSRWQIFKHVTFPSLRNTHVFVIVATTILGFKLFTQVNLLTQGGPQNATQTMVMMIYESGFKTGKVGFASALSVLFFLVVLGISLLQRVIFRNEDR